PSAVRHQQMIRSWIRLCPPRRARPVDLSYDLFGNEQRVDAEQVEKGADHRLAAVQADREVAFPSASANLHQQANTVGVEELHTVEVEDHFTSRAVDLVHHRGSRS